MHNIMSFGGFSSKDTCPHNKYKMKVGDDEMFS